MAFVLMLVLFKCLLAHVSGENITDEAYCYNASTVQRCGSTIEANNSIIRSPVYENKTWTYPSNTDCSWTVKAPLGYIIKFEFLCFLSFESTSSSADSCNDDYVRIMYALGGNHTYCGTLNITELSPTATTANHATVTFHSDDTGTSKGFVLRVVFEKKYEASCFLTSDIRPCGSTFLRSVTLRSPKDVESWNYPDNINCTWNFRAPAFYVWKFQFKCFFGTEALSSGSTCALDDYVKIDGSSYCGTHELGKLKPRISRGNQTSVTFHSNSRGSGLGFVLEAELQKSTSAESCYDPKTVHPCGSVITVNNTIIRSEMDKNRNNYYPSKTIDCSWTVEAPPGYYLMFEYFCFFSTSNSFTHTCNFGDWLLIKPDNSRGIKRCGTFGLYELAPYYTNSRRSKLTFHSDFFSSHKGFVLRAVFVSSGKSLSAMLLLVFMMTALTALIY